MSKFYDYYSFIYILFILQYFFYLCAWNFPVRQRWKDSSKFHLDQVKENFKTIIQHFDRSFVSHWDLTLQRLCLFWFRPQEIVCMFRFQSAKIHRFRFRRWKQNTWSKNESLSGEHLICLHFNLLLSWMYLV